MPARPVEGPGLGRFWRPGPMLLIGPALLICVATYGRAARPSAWWIAALLAALLVRAAVLRLDREVERLYARLVGLGAVAWLCAAWQIGPYRAPLVLALLLLSPASVVPWAIHRRVRGAVTVDWPRSALSREFARAFGRQWAAAREYRRMKAAWPWLAILKDIGLPGSELVKGHWTKDGKRRLRLRLENAKVLADVERVLGRIEAGWEAAPGTLSVAAAEGAGAHHVDLTILPALPVAVKPLSVVRGWPGPTIASVREPLALGEWEDGTPILLRLTTEAGMVAGHWLVAGMTRWGKSGILNVILATLAVCPDVVFWGLDPKGGLELGPWHPLLQRLATSARDAVPFLQAANAERERRQAILRERGQRLWVPTAAEPLLLLVVDEASRLDEDAMRLLDDLCAMGAAGGICVIVCTQRPSAAKLGKTGDLRAQLGSQISVHLRDAADGNLVFGDGSASEGWRPCDLSERGALLIYHELSGYEEPRPGRAYWVSDEAVSAIVARHASVRSQSDSAPEERERPVSHLDDERPSRIVPYLPLVPVAEAAEPGRSALHVVDEVESEDPLARLRAALRDAPRDGMRRAELIARTGMSDSWVDQHLRELRAAEEAVCVGRARWRAAADSPVRALAQEESR